MISSVSASVLMLLATTIFANPVIRRQTYTCGLTSDNNCVLEFQNNPNGVCDSRCATDSNFRDNCAMCCEVCLATESSSPTPAPTTAAPTPAPSTSPTEIYYSCGGTNSGDCLTEWENQGLATCGRCTSEFSFRERCQLCCDSCWPTPAPTMSPTSSPTPCAQTLNALCTRNCNWRWNGSPQNDQTYFDLELSGSNVAISDIAMQVASKTAYGRTCEIEVYTRPGSMTTSRDDAKAIAQSSAGWTLAGSGSGTIQNTNPDLSVELDNPVYLTCASPPCTWSVAVRQVTSNCKHRFGKSGSGTTFTNKVNSQGSVTITTAGVTSSGFGGTYNSYFYWSGTLGLEFCAAT